MPSSGRRIPSLTGLPLVAGRATFVNDLLLPGLTWIAFLRSPHPHARIRSIDPSPAEAIPGVVRVLTGADVLAALAPIPSGADVAAWGSNRQPGMRS
jgi:aerobic carbon-monoxide dehydrogenase large subunit